MILILNVHPRTEEIILVLF